MKKNVKIPADVPHYKEQEYVDNYAKLTAGTNKIFLFAGDQKLEHLNGDFYGPTIHADAQDPEHLFKIARQGRIGLFATHLGLIARYGKHYESVNYLVKMNGKTDRVPLSHRDPVSRALWTVDDVVGFKNNSGLSICGIGYTIYLGSEYEVQMLTEAAQVIYHAHQHGLVAGLWVYPRGAHVKNDDDPQLIAGSAGVAAVLGADFVKIKSPNNMDDLKRAVIAAGNTKVICSGGILQDSDRFLRMVYDQLHNGNASGCAVGRNIFQKSLPEAIEFTNVIAELVFDGAKIE